MAKRYASSDGEVRMYRTQRFLTTAVTAVFLLVIGQPLLSQNTPKANASVANVQLIETVSLQLTVFSPETQLIVPYCGEGESGSETLCNLAIHVEVETGSGWRPMRLRTTDAVLGGVPSDRWKVRQIAAGRRRDFVFAFPKNEFAVEHGQRLRIVIDAWPDEHSMKMGGAPIKLTTAPFKCP
jgi:hypothetical protein